MFRLFSLTFFWLAACQTPPTPLPIAETKLIEIIADVHLAEAGFRELPYQLKDSLAPIYYERIMASHQVSMADFDSSMFIIREDPDRLQAIYTKVMEQLSTREAESQ